MPPHWVRDLDSYWSWLEREVSASGGYLTEVGALAPNAYEGDSGALRLLHFPSHRLVFHDGLYLAFSLVVTEAVDVIEYSFHLAEIEGEMRWRVCRNDHRIEETGTEFHLHLPKNLVLPWKEVDFAQAVEAKLSGRIPGDQP